MIRGQVGAGKGPRNLAVVPRIEGANGASSRTAGFWTPQYRWKPACTCSVPTIIGTMRLPPLRFSIRPRADRPAMALRSTWAMCRPCRSSLAAPQLGSRAC